MAYEPKTLKRPHPSNRLYNNEVGSFIEAMQVYQQQMDHENRVTEELAAMSGHPITANERKLMKRLSDGVAKASEAMEIYAKHYAAAEEAILAELRAKDDSEFDAFADALASGDYSDLAV